MKLVFSENDYRLLKKGETYANQFVILSLDNFKPEYQTAQFQLFYAETGFGCNPSNLGGKVFGRIFDERFQTRREDILGVATEDAITEWEKTYGMSRNVFTNKEEN